MEGKQEIQTFYIDFYKKRKHHDREKSRSVDIQDNVVVEPPPSSNRMDMDSEDSDYDLENATVRSYQSTKNPHTSLHTYAKNVPEATQKKIYMAPNGQ